MRKKYFILPLLMLVIACGSETYNVIDSEEEAVRANRITESEQPKQDRVFFKFDSAALGEEAKKTLDKTAIWLNNDGDINILIEGHCDERGTREYNLALGQRRADSAKRYLVSKGVNSSRIRTISYGKERPAVVGKGEAIWSKNRRSVIVVK